jgi:hypothetical protein
MNQTELRPEILNPTPAKVVYTALGVWFQIWGVGALAVARWNAPTALDIGEQALDLCLAIAALP